MFKNPITIIVAISNGLNIANFVLLKINFPISKAIKLIITPKSGLFVIPSIIFSLLFQLNIAQLKL